MKTIKIISVRQPWAWLLVTDKLKPELQKDIENRTWDTQYRGELLIHASQKFDYDAFIWLLENHMLGTYGQVASHFGLIHGKTTAGEFGGIVGKGNLSGIVTDSSSRWADPGCKHWQITDRTELPFVQCKGQLRLWDCPEDIIEQYRKLEIKL